MYHLHVIRRLYVNNFRCLENFDLPVAGRSSALLLGKNGAGKTTVALALEKLQLIARGFNKVGELLKPNDITRGRTDIPLRFEIEVEIQGSVYGYTVAFDYPKGFKELRVLEEKLTVEGTNIYRRSLATVYIAKEGAKGKEASFLLNWHLVALPVLQQSSTDDPVSAFKEWLARMLILRPAPSLIKGDSRGETLQPTLDVSNYGAWFSGLLAQAPSSYTTINDYLKQVMPDLVDIQNPLVSADSRSLTIQFENKLGGFRLPFEYLSDGEKCFMICALVVSANKAYGPLFCFWDEPDNYLSLDEVGHFVLTLRKAFQASGQFIATSHSAEAIRRFSEDNTLFLFRRSRLEPTVVDSIEDMKRNGKIAGDLVSAITLGDLEP